MLENFTILIFYRLISGKINDVSWENILEDSIFEVGGSVTGEKTLKNNLKVENLNLTGRINGLLFEELAELATNHENTIVLDKDTALENSLNVEELIFEGKFQRFSYFSAT